MFRLLNLALPCFLLMALSSCNVQSTAKSLSTSTNQMIKPENKIVFLFFEIEKAENGIEKVTLTKTTASAGFVKNASIDNTASTAGNLLISLIGKNGNVLEERIMEDPLNPLLEVYAEEGLSKNKINLQKAEFSVRFNQKGEISAVKIEKITSNSKINLLTLQL